MTLGQRIQHHRTKLNLSQEALGEKLGVTRQAVHKWEADGAVPDTDKLIALSRLFGITLNELLQVEEPKKAEEADPAPTKPAVNLKLRTTLMAISIIILGIATLICAVNVATLRKEVALLKEQVAQSTGLNPAAPLVADFSYQIESPLGEYASMHLDLLPYQLPENLTVTFTVTSLYDSEKNKTVISTRGEGGHYTADLSVYYPYLITATLSNGVNEYAQPLVRILDYKANSYSWSWETLWNK